MLACSTCQPRHSEHSSQLDLQSRYVTSSRSTAGELLKATKLVLSIVFSHTFVTLS